MTLFWALITRLGEAQILLPAALVAMATLMRQPPARPLVACWLLLLCTAVLLTTASKLAFIGWGFGWPELNFTGVSGHAMFAAAVYPVLFATLVTIIDAQRRKRAIALGCLMGAALALLIGASRVVVGAHTSSEVIAGLVLGGAVSAATLTLQRPPQSRMSAWMPVAVTMWLVLLPTQAPASSSHSMVTQLALSLAGHHTPYTRAQMLRAARLREPA